MCILNFFQETIYWPYVVREQRFAQQSESVKNFISMMYLVSCLIVYMEIGLCSIYKGCPKKGDPLILIQRASQSL